MRGAIGEMDSVEIEGLEKDNKEFAVKFDPQKSKLETILAALEAAGEPAKKLD